MSALTRDELFRLLDERIASPEIAAAQEAELWQRCGRERAVLVLDLSGFTRLTKSHGILHFLTIFRRAIRLASPAIAEKGRVLKLDADNVIGVFDRASDALDAAERIVAIALRENDALALDERVRACIGIGYGRILELADDLYGDEVNVAFKLGEDVARPEEILLSDAAKSRLDVEGRGCDVERRDASAGGVVLAHFRLLAKRQ